MCTDTKVLKVTLVAKFDSNSMVVMLHASIGMKHTLVAYNYKSSLCMRLEYKLVDANRVCPGIHKVRVKPATWSMVATQGGCFDCLMHDNQSLLIRK